MSLTVTTDASSLLPSHFYCLQTMTNGFIGNPCEDQLFKYICVSIFKVCSNQKDRVVAVCSAFTCGFSNKELRKQALPVRLFEFFLKDFPYYTIQWHSFTKNYSFPRRLIWTSDFVTSNPQQNWNFSWITLILLRLCCFDRLSSGCNCSTIGVTQTYQSKDVT